MPDSVLGNGCGLVERLFICVFMNGSLLCALLFLFGLGRGRLLFLRHAEFISGSVMLISFSLLAGKASPLFLITKDQTIKLWLCCRINSLKLYFGNASTR
jgi:hypothetical protein